MAIVLPLQSCITRELSPPRLQAKMLSAMIPAFSCTLPEMNAANDVIQRWLRGPEHSIDPTAVSAVGSPSSTREAAVVCANRRRSSAADLKFLEWLPRVRVGNFKSKSGTRNIYLLVPLLFPKFVQMAPQWTTNFGNGALV